jgi:SAM-dependent methyltransferase
MAKQPNDAEIANWNGPIGERWVAHQEMLDARLQVFSPHLLAAAELTHGQRILDIGCGCGAISLEVARAVGPTGHVVGLDVSRPMLARARDRAKDHPNIELVEHDATTYTASAPFDTLVSRFGVMFFDDPTVAFTNLRRATNPGGRISFVCWQPLADNDWASVPLSAVLRVLPPGEPSRPRAPGPFAFGEADYVDSILKGAGWSAIELTPRSQPFGLGDTLDDAVDYATSMGPSGRALRTSEDDATRERAREMLRQTLAPFGPSFALQSAVWLVTARA